MSRNDSRLAHLWRGLALTSSIALVTLAPAPALAQGDDAGASQPGPFADIPTYRMSAERTHIQPGTVPLETPGLVWSARLASEIHFNPLIVDGTLYVGDYDGVFHALDPVTGSQRWAFSTDDIIDNVATSADGVVAFRDGGGQVHVLDAGTGGGLWSAAGFTGPIEVSDGILYTSSEDGVLHGLGLTSGEEIWSQQMNAPAQSLTITGGVAYVGTTGGEVFAIVLADGSRPWRSIRLLSDLPSSMPITDGILYASSLQPPGEPAGELLAIDAASGEILWRFRSPSGRQVPPGAVRDGVLYVGSESDGLYALNAANGEIIWHVPDAPTVYTPVSLSGDSVIVPGADGDLLAYDAADGAERWRVRYGVGNNVGPAISGGLIFQADSAGTLFAFGDAALAQDPSSVAMEADTAAVADAVSSPFVHVATWDASMIEGLDQPAGADVGPDGLYHVVSASSNEIVVLDEDGSVVRRWGEAGTGDGQFDFQRDPNDPFGDIGGVAVAPDGSVYVADTVNRRVQRFSAEGEFMGKFGSYGSGDGQFLEPIDLDVGPDGSVYVVDDVRDDIQRFGADGIYLQTIGRQGRGDGELQYTGSIVVTDDGTLLNADWENNRVQAWDASGEFLWTFGKRGTELGEFRLVGDVAVDETGRLFVTDFDNGRVQAFSGPGEPLGEWVIPPDELSLSYNITYAGEGRLYLNNPFGDRIHVLQYVGD